MATVESAVVTAAGDFSREHKNSGDVTKDSMRKGGRVGLLRGWGICLRLSPKGWCCFVSGCLFLLWGVFHGKEERI